MLHFREYNKLFKWAIHWFDAQRVVVLTSYPVWRVLFEMKLANATFYLLYLRVTI
jgi:hypothetical protein